MKTIILNEKEIEVIKAQLNGEIEIWTTEEVENVLGGVIDKAEALMHELEAYDDANGRLIEWYWEMYNKQTANGER